MNELDAKTNNWIVEDKSRLVPYQGLGVIGPQSIYFNTNNFYKSPEEFFQDDEFFNSSQFDLHDLVHYGVGASNPNFASKYYPTYNSEDEVCEAGLISLPLELQHLITSNPKNENLKSDGYILTNLTFQWFYEKFEQLGSPINIQKKDQTNIVEYISDKLKAYLLENRINIIELAVLMQNKLYEATASECETAVFVRGGKDNTRGRAHLDPLFNKNAFEIIEIVAKAATQPDFRFHHEHRNTLRNRAQVLAYKKVAQEFHSRAQKDGKNINPGYLIMCKKIQSAGSKPVATNLFNDVYNLLRNNA